MSPTAGFYAQFDPSGNPIWSGETTAGMNDETLLGAVAADAGGHSYLTGSFFEKMSLPGSCGLTGPTNVNSIWVGIVETSGQSLHCNGYGTNGNSGGTLIAVPPAGTNVVVAGVLGGAVNFGGGSLVGSGGADNFLVQLDGSLNYQWAKALTAANLTSVAVDGSGNVIVAGIFSYSADYGGPTMLAGSTGTTLGVAKFDSSGNYQWSKSFDPSGQFVDFPTVYMANVAVDAGGGIFLGGLFSGTIDFGGGTLDSMAEGVPYLAKLDPTGAHV